MAFRPGAKLKCKSQQTKHHLVQTCLHSNKWRNGDVVLFNCSLTCFTEENCMKDGVLNWWWFAWSLSLTCFSMFFKKKKNSTCIEITRKVRDVGTECIECIYWHCNAVTVQMWPLSSVAQWTGWLRCLEWVIITYEQDKHVNVGTQHRLYSLDLLMFVWSHSALKHLLQLKWNENKDFSLAKIKRNGQNIFKESFMKRKALVQ